MCIAIFVALITFLTLTYHDFGLSSTVWLTLASGVITIFIETLILYSKK